ncbi:MAG: dihydroxyacetone kinase subunit DhaL [Methanoregula sp.]|jgi:phosphoenolpyruvate---glycerone phosphotransferase subunit DhaL
MNNSQAISGAELRDALLHVCDVVQENEQHLNDLDSAIGDGDHGITMRIGFAAVRKRLLVLPADAASGALLVETGKTFMQSTGGAIGVILGRAFVASGIGIGGAKQMGSEEFRSCFAAMEKAVAQTGKAMPGDKTLLDPLHALNEALSSLPAGTPASSLLAAAAAAAEKAAQGTADTPCRIGRASKLGDRALGHADPGAVSFALIVRALSESLCRLSPTVQKQ